jgi:hypothetical protein
MQLIWRSPRTLAVIGTVRVSPFFVSGGLGEPELREQRKPRGQRGKKSANHRPKELALPFEMDDQAG